MAWITVPLRFGKLQVEHFYKWKELPSTPSRTLGLGKSSVGLPEKQMPWQDAGVEGRTFPLLLPLIAIAINISTFQDYDLWILTK